MRLGKKTRIFRAFYPGLAITALVILANCYGLLMPVENPLYDARMRYCQQFIPEPTKQLVHLDLDDAAIESIGRWPWPRSVMAEIYDEIGRAGAKVVASDIVLSDVQQPTYLPNGKVIDNDALLAASLKKMGCALVPVSFKFDPLPAFTPAQRRIAEVLQSDPAINFDDLRVKLQSNDAGISEEDYLPVLRRAISDRVSSEMAKKPGDLNQIQQRILGNRADAVDPMILEVIHVEYQKYESQQAIKPLGKKLAQPMTDVLIPESELLMIPSLGRAAAYTAFVDHLPHGDGVERSVPLWIEYQGELYPQMGLELACATLGVSLDRLKISQSQLTIPLNDGRQIVIPTHSFFSKKLNKSVGYAMDIPWFGTGDWRTMYDYPAHLYPAQHLPIGKVWQLAEFRKKGVNNNLAIDERLGMLNKDLGENYIKDFLAHPPAAQILDSRVAITNRVLKEATDFLADDLKAPAAKLAPDDAFIVGKYHELQKLLNENQRIVADEAEMKQTLGGKSILIGSITTGAYDFATTPLHAQCPGVIVHGAIFNAIMTNHLLRQAGRNEGILATGAVGLLATVAVTTFTPWAALLATALLVAGYCLLNGMVIYGYEGVILDAAGPIVAGMFVWGGVTLMQYITEIAERRRITNRFAKYADKKLVNYFLSHPEQDFFAGQEREMTCVFTDMQGYTSLMERLGKDVVPALSEYMGRMTTIIEQYEGLVNKFLGDGIMFFYGAPERDPQHATRAVQTVLEMQQNGVPRFNQWLREQGLDLQVAVRAGVSTGLMIVGDTGSQGRTDYTVLGDAVNLASRLESANKYLGTQSMITARTAELCGEAFLLRPVARIQVVGKSEPVMTYEPMAYRERATEEQRRLAGLSQEIFAAYGTAEFERCLELIGVAEGEMGSSKLFALYASYCRRYLEHPLAGFDGRIKLEEK